MALAAPYGQHNYLGSHAGEAACLTWIQAQKWDSTKNGSGTPENGMTFYDTSATKMKVYENGAWVVIGNTTLADHLHAGVAGDGGQLDHDNCFSDYGTDNHTEYILATGTRDFSGAVKGVDGSDNANLTTKGYVDALVSGLQWLKPAAYKDYIGSRTIAQIDALSPTAGWTVVAADAGTPAAAGSDLLAIGDIAEYSANNSWKKRIANMGNYPPADTRLIISEGTLYSPLTEGVDEGKIATFDGTSLTPASKYVTQDGDAILLNGDPGVNENKQYVFDGAVPTGTWVQFGGAGMNHNSLSGLQGGAANDYYHLTSADKTDLTDGNATTLHKHSHLNMDDIGTNSHATIDSHIADVSIHTEFYTQAGTPEGVTTAANIGDKSLDTTNKIMYVKTTAGGNTGWVVC